MFETVTTFLPKTIAADVRGLAELFRPDGQRARMRSYCKGEGIEVGALHNPLELPRAARVSYVDRLSVGELRTQYPELADSPLVPVSIRATAEDLFAVPSDSQDFVVANHLLEHCENPLRALAEFDRVLKPGGVLYLALPDPKHTFDRTRALTTTEHLVDEFRNGPEKNRFAHYMDWSVNVDGLGEARARELQDRSYAIHFHVWTPHTFRAFFEAAKLEAGLQSVIIDFDAGSNEFIFVLRKGETLLDRALRRLPISNRVPALLRELAALAPLAWIAGARS